MYANGFTMWHFRSDDTANDVFAPGYFDMAADMLRVGDLLFANLEAMGHARHGLMVVAENSAGVVSVATPGFSIDQTPDENTTADAQA